MPEIKYKFRLLLLVFSVLLLFVVYLILTTGKRNKDVYIVFRYDDYTSTSSRIIEEEIIKAIHENHFSCSFGIIPYSLDTLRLVPLDSLKILLIKKEVQNGMVEVCQHGYLHKAIFDIEPFSEFKGMDAEEQLKKISTAKEFLEKEFITKITAFIPPWNSFDRNTLKTLVDLGFENISADQSETKLREIRLNYLPFTAYLPDLVTLMDYKGLPVKHHATVVMLMVHDYDFREVNRIDGITDLAEFRALIRRMVDRNWKIVSINEATDKLHIFGQDDYKMNGLKLLLLSHLDLISGFSLVFHKLDIINYIYLSGIQITMLFLIVLLYYLVVLLVFSELIYQTIGRVLFKQKYNRIYLITGISLLALSVTAFLMDDQVVGKSEALVLVFLLGFLCSIFYRSYERPL